MSIMLRRILFFLPLLQPYFIQAIVIGSDTVPSREAAVTFLSTDDDNEMRGFAAFENGFSFENKLTTCTFDALFPVSGTVNINGGSLYLQQDINFDCNTNFVTMGHIYGNGYRLNFSETTDTFTVISQPLTSNFLQIDSESLSGDVNAADWTYDDQYIGAGVDTNILYAYSFNGQALNLLDSVDVGNNIWTVRAHPTGYYFAIGASALTEELRVYELSGGVLSITTSADVTPNPVYAVDWAPSGTMLMVGHGTQVSMYTFVADLLVPLANLNYGGDAVQENALCCDRTGAHFAVGTGANLRIFYFDGTNITNKYTLATGGPNVESVDWSHTGSFIAAGLVAGATNEIRVYEYDSDANTLTPRAGIEIGEDVYTVHWSSDTTKLVVGTSLYPTGEELRVYTFNPSTYALALDGSYELSTNVRDARWASNDRWIVVGDDADNLTVFSYSSASDFAEHDILFQDVLITVEHDIDVLVDTRFHDRCVIDGNGHKFTFSGNGSFLVEENTFVTFENVEFAGLQSDNFACQDHTGRLVFRNCVFHLDHDWTFSYGSILFQEENMFSGTNKFIYESTRASTIIENALVRFETNTTFSYAPKAPYRDLIYMIDKSSGMYFNGATLRSTTTGIRLTRGRLCLDNNVTLSSASTNESEMITFGNGVADDDLFVCLLSGADIKIYGGLHVDNVV